MVYKHWMRAFLFLFALVLVIAPVSAMAQGADVDADEEEEEFELPSGAKWLEGPGVGKIGDLAEIQVPEGYVFTDGPGTRYMMKLMENMVSDREMGFIAPRDFDWFITFEYDDSGHVKDDEKINATQLMKDMKEGNKYENEERKKMGWPALNVIGWYKEPFYNPKTKNLEWGIELESEGVVSINQNIRFLGREGVMEVTVVAGPDEFGQVLKLAEGLLGSYRYVQGQTYAEYRKGDRLAQYGLTGLIAGGGVAVLAKSGVLKPLLKFLAIPLIAVIGLFSRLLKGKKKTQ